MVRKAGRGGACGLRAARLGGAGGGCYCLRGANQLPFILFLYRFIVISSMEVLFCTQSFERVRKDSSFSKPDFCFANALDRIAFSPAGGPLVFLHAAAQLAEHSGTPSEESSACTVLQLEGGVCRAKGVESGAAG